MSDSQWLTKKLQYMLSVADTFKSICPGVYYTTGAWSTIKLLTLLNYVPIYTKIIPRHFPSMHYIELLAGTGLCKIRETQDIVAGSTLIASTVCYSPFDKYILVEKDRRSAEALEKRMKTVTNNAAVLMQDCNDCIREVLETLPSRGHYLAFVDCEGLDVDWSTMNFLLSKPGDLLFTFQSQFVARVRGRAIRGSKGNEEKLNRFYGDDRWKTCKSPEDLVVAYVNKVGERRGIVVPIYVKGPRGFQYYVLYATITTSTGSPWVKGVTYLKQRVEGCDYRWVKGILNVLTGRQLTISDLI